MSKRKSGKREPNGRLSRTERTTRILDGLDQEQRDTLSVGIEARERVLGVDPKHTRDQLAGCYVGRLCITGELTRIQYDALMTWLEDQQNYAIAVASPRQPGAVDLNRTQGSSNYENEARTRHYVARYKGAHDAVTARQIELRGTGALFAALDHLVRRDLELAHMVGDVRQAANALVRHYGLVTGRRAA